MINTYLRYIVKLAVTVGDRSGSFSGEESPDCIEQGVLLLKKDTADHIPQEGKCHRKDTAFVFEGKGEMVG